MSYGDKKVTINTSGLWKFDGNANDLSGNGYTLTDTGSSITYQVGKYGLAGYKPDNSRSSILQRTTDVLGSGMQYSTVNFWAKVLGYAAWEMGYFCSFVSTATKRSYYFPISATAVNMGTFDKTGAGQYDGHWHESGVTISYDRSQWHMYTYTINNYVCTIYLDSKLIHTFDITAPDGNTAFQTSAVTCLGSNTYGLSSGDLDPIVGYMDDFFIENRVWTSTEVLRYYAYSTGKIHNQMS